MFFFQTGKKRRCFLVGFLHHQISCIDYSCKEFIRFLYLDILYYLIDVDCNVLVKFSKFRGAVCLQVEHLRSFKIKRSCCCTYHTLNCERLPSQAFVETVCNLAVVCTKCQSILKINLLEMYSLNLGRTSRLICDLEVTDSRQY